METFIEQISGYGITGLAAIAAGWLYLKERVRNDEMQSRLDVIQEKRLDEARSGIKGLADNTNALQGLIDYLKERALK